MVDRLEGTVRVQEITEVVAGAFLESFDGDYKREVSVLEVGARDVRGHEEQSSWNCSC